MHSTLAENNDLYQQLQNNEYLNELRQQMMKFAVLQLSSFQQAEMWCKKHLRVHLNI